MTEYKVIAREVTSIVWRDVHKAAQDLAAVCPALPARTIVSCAEKGGTLAPPSRLPA